MKSLYHFNNTMRKKQQTQDKDIRILETRADNLDNTSSQLDQKCDLMCKQLQTISLEIEKLKELQQQQHSTESNNNEEGKVLTNSFRIFPMAILMQLDVVALILLLLLALPQFSFILKNLHNSHSFLKTFTILIHS